jgi:hypothetical protein
MSRTEGNTDDTNLAPDTSTFLRRSRHDSYPTTEGDCTMTTSDSNYILYYTSADDSHDDSPWSVWREAYVNPEDNEPIDGSQTWVGSYPTEDAADEMARWLQNRKPAHD